MGTAQRSRLLAAALLVVSTGVVGLVGPQSASAATTKIASLQNVVPAPVTVVHAASCATSGLTVLASDSCSADH